MSDLEVNAECPDCGAGNAIRAGNQMDSIFCGQCGWVDDPDWDGPMTRSELREQRRAERENMPTADLDLEQLESMIEAVRPPQQTQLTLSPEQMQAVVDEYRTNSEDL
jgi:rubredoxin